MLIKTSDLIGPALDWAVAQAAEYTTSTLDLLYDIKSYDKYRPSTDWVFGGPIIEREKIDLSWQSAGQAGWMAYGHDSTDCGIPLYDGNGPTPLIAAMRCYVASKFGDEVEVPDDLT